MDAIPPGLLNGAGVIALLVGLFWMLASGRLFTRRQYDDKAHEANEWRAESRVKDAQIAEKDEQLRHLAEVGNTVDAVMRAIQRGSKDHEVPE